jgi:hypothetical protein
MIIIYSLNTKIFIFWRITVRQGGRTLMMEWGRKGMGLWVAVVGWFKIGR